jgi:NADPH-dependent ferric siderophore reductase
VPPIAQRVSDAAARVLLRSATVTAVADHGEFRSIDLAGERLVELEWVPGDKIRIRAGALALRTYTPVSWDRAAGRTRILAYVHGHGPGSEWCAAAQTGARCDLRGPDRSVRLDRISGPPVFVGDETSLGLLLAQRATAGTSRATAATLLEVADRDATRPALSAYGVDDAVVFERGPAAGGPLGEAVVEAVRAYPDATVVLTGRAQTIATLRRTLKAAGLAARPAVVKAYWDENRKGLD